MHNAGNLKKFSDHSQHSQWSTSGLRC